MASRPTRLRYGIRHNDMLSKCESHKRCFPTKATALDGAERLMEKGFVKPGCHITPYLCRDCHYWHVWNRPIVQVP